MEISVGRLAQERGDFRHIDGRESVQAQMQAVPRAGLADRRTGGSTKAFHGIWRQIALNIKIADLTCSCPGNGLFHRLFIADINANAVAEGRRHGETRARKRRRALPYLRHHAPATARRPDARRKPESTSEFGCDS